MAKTLHTHTGTCQACGRIQAVDNTSHLVAKHGYTVDWGYFTGTCPGSGYLPAEWETKLTQKIITDCTAQAAEQDELAGLFHSHQRSPLTFKRWNPNLEWTTKGGFRARGKDETLPIAEATKAELDHAHEVAEHNAQDYAKHLRAHAKALTERVLPRNGQPLFPVVREDRRELRHGQRFKRGGTTYSLEKPRYAFGSRSRGLGRVVGWFAVNVETQGRMYVNNKQLRDATTVWLA